MNDLPEVKLASAGQPREGTIDEMAIGGINKQADEGIRPQNTDIVPEEHALKNAESDAKIEQTAH